MKKSHLIGASCAAILSFTSMSSQAATLNISGGILMGVNSLNVNGTLYDATFVDGSCAALFNGCNEPSDFSFQDVTTAHLASDALLAAIAGSTFDTNVGQTFGIATPNPSQGGLAQYVIPYEYFLYNGVSPQFNAVIANNYAAVADWTQDCCRNTIDSDYSQGYVGGYSTLVNFEVSAVPVPAAVWLFGSGLLGLVGIARRKKA